MDSKVAKSLSSDLQLLKSAIKDTDVLARLAGDELILFLTNIKDKQMLDREAYKIIREILAAPIVIDNITVTPTFSMGISIYPDDSKNLDDLIKQADLAMYHAKKHGESYYCYFNEVNQKKVVPTTPVPLS